MALCGSLASLLQILIYAPAINVWEICALISFHFFFLYFILNFLFPNNGRTDPIELPNSSMTFELESRTSPLNATQHFFGTTGPFTLTQWWQKIVVSLECASKIGSAGQLGLLSSPKSMGWICVGSYRITLLIKIYMVSRIFKLHLQPKEFSVGHTCICRWKGQNLVQ